ncbi:MAG: glycoside hydrolase family 16 protein [Chitinophagaceae bacterium]|nr:glycoside hydrolase family 16 protein [Chitinophagaceae bacterium]
MKIFRLYVLAGGFLFCMACSVQKQAQKTVLKWEENFDQTGTFDITRWSKIPRGTPEWQKYMSDFDSCYAMRDGRLILRGIVNHSLPNDTARYLTGGIYTKDKVAFGFGRLEIYAKLNGARGAWPAFWLLSQDMKWPDGGEIDIMERLNFDSIAYQTVHSHYTYNLKMKEPKQGATGPIDPNGFNTYTVELHRDSLVFFINNKRTFSYPRIQTDREGQFPFDQYKYYLLLDMQLGGSWVGEVDPADLPVEMEIDWVRFYEFKE